VGNAKDPEEEFIEAATEKSLEMLVAAEMLVPFDDVDGTTKYRTSSKLNHLATANRRRRG